MSIHDRSLQRAVYSAEVLHSRVEAVMANITVMAHPKDPINGLMRDMTERRARHVPVMSEGKLVGVVSIGDILKSRIADRPVMQISA